MDAEDGAVQHAALDADELAVLAVEGVIDARDARAALYNTLDANSHKLTAPLQMDDAAFRKHKDKSKKWWEVLGLDSMPAVAAANCITTVKTLREKFKNYPFLVDEGSSFARWLGLQGVSPYEQEVWHTAGYH